LPEGERKWLFLTNHAHVLIAVSRDPNARVRDIAERVGITERATQLILRDLEDAGFVEVTRVGRRNVYQVSLDKPMRHPLHEGFAVDELIGLLSDLRAVGPGTGPR